MTAAGPPAIRRTDRRCAASAFASLATPAQSEDCRGTTGQGETVARPGGDAPGLARVAPQRGEPAEDERGGPEAWDVGSGDDPLDGGRGRAADGPAGGGSGEEDGAEPLGRLHAV